MEDLSFWQKFLKRPYFSYFIIFFANIVCWLGSFQILSIFTSPDPPTFYIFIFTITTIFLNLITGKFIDHVWSRRKFIILGIILYSLGFILSYLTIFGYISLIDSTFNILLISLFLGMGFGVSTISIGSYFADHSIPTERGKLQGLSYCISFAIGFNYSSSSR